MTEKCALCAILYGTDEAASRRLASALAAWTDPRHPPIPTVTRLDGAWYLTADVEFHVWGRERDEVAEDKEHRHSDRRYDKATNVER